MERDVTSCPSAGRLLRNAFFGVQLWLQGHGRWNGVVVGACLGGLVANFAAEYRPMPTSTSHPAAHSRTASAALFEEARLRFPGGVNSPVRAFGAVGAHRSSWTRGGAHIWDADGQRYIDFCCSWGPLILGHAHPCCSGAHHVGSGQWHFIWNADALENELGGLILDNHPFAERIRFVSSGTEAAMSAIRLARG